MKGPAGKILVFIAAIPAAILVAAIYGLLHDQLSYTFSPEYFTRFKFIQFGVPWAHEHPRAGAAVVGMLATWWMGLIIVIPLGIFGFFFPTPRDMIRALTRAFIVVLLIAAATGLAGLAYGYMIVDASTVSAYMMWIREGVADPVQFVRVGFMHNASYLGGAVGLLGGLASLIIEWRSHRERNT